MFPIIFVLIVVIQRLVELFIARRNERWMKDHGAIEFGKSHYVLMVAIHTLFFVFLTIELFTKGFSLHRFWIPLFLVFLLTQIGRVWVIKSLGKFWNTKIIVLPNTNIVAKGPYQFIKHPNYLIVTVELLVIPLMFNAYLTLVIFAILNQLILYIRIPLEEKALRQCTNYNENHHSRFNPFIKQRT
ncbi:hypothetical protein Q73_07855 [Bacillus coahuilensis m2-6]|uniref:isoprenylcysteine carboxyl methyltransferase family protein n=1 Tax=Bacillus coahuilensis TaxID=408580 RepID=UPI0001850F1D|nr:isoprenylcysteine carboxylmethyltransferase family protein [Bacillus coahuilensis]KUP08006.1 hypothetical protein Q73_07855 [Bacillus coahuilensis m2-6]